MVPVDCFVQTILYIQLQHLYFPAGHVHIQNLFLEYHDPYFALNPVSRPFKAQVRKNRNLNGGIRTFANLKESRVQGKQYLLMQSTIRRSDNLSSKFKYLRKRCSSPHGLGISLNGKKACNAQ